MIYKILLMQIMEKLRHKKLEHRYCNLIGEYSRIRKIKRKMDKKFSKRKLKIVEL